MAVVGSADIIVRAITTGVKKDIERGFSGLSGVGARSGRQLGNSLTRAFRSAVNQKSNGLTRLRDEIQQLYPEADAAAKNFTRLMRVGYVLQGAIGAVGGSVGALGGGLISLVGAAGGAAASLAVLGPIVTSFGLAMAAARLALGGIDKALTEASKSAGGAAKNTQAIEEAQRSLARVIESSNERIVGANKRLERAQTALNQAFEDGREQIQQLNFDAEDAAISEAKAALELERARETLLRVQDLPPNSRARREAELAYAEADLSYRRAIDTNADLAKEQERLAAKGVEGTDAVINAREELASAEEDLATTLRDTAREQEDAQRALQRALTETGAAGASAYNKLNEAQQDFVDYLLALKPLVDELKNSISQELLPELQTAIQNIVDGAFPSFKVGLAEVADALGDAAITFSTAFQDSSNIALLDEIFNNAAVSIRKFGDISKPALGAVLALLVGIDPLAQRFLDWIIESTEEFEKFLKSPDGQESVTYFFQEAGNQAARFGQIAGNAFIGLSKVIFDSFKPGSGADTLLTYFEKVSASFANADPTKLNFLLAGTSENAVKLFDALGDVFGILLQIGAMPEVGQFWDALSGSAAEFAYMLREAVKTAPALGELISTFVRIFAIFADSGQAIAFLGTLQNIAGAFLKIAEDMKPFLDTIGPLIGTISAVTLAFGLLGTAFSVMAGFAGIASGGLGTLIGLLTGTAGAASAAAAAQTGATAATAGLGLALKTAFLTNPIGLAITGIVAAGAGLLALFQGIKQERIDKSVNAISVELRGAADSQKIWNNALLTLPDGRYKEALSGVNGLKNGIEGLNKSVSNGSTDWRTYKVDQDKVGQNQATTEALGSIGKALADLATNDIAAAKSAFQEMAKANDLSNKEISTALENMPEFKQALADQAAQYGINIIGTDGLIDSQEALNFAMDRGKIKSIQLAEAAEEESRRHNAAMQEKISKMSEAALSNSKYFDSLKESYKEGEFNLKTYLNNSQTRLETAQKLVAVKAKLIARGATDEMLNMVDSLGDNALKGAQDMLALTDLEFGKIVSNSQQAGFLASKEFANGMTQQQPLIKQVAAKMGSTASSQLIEELSSAKNLTDMQNIASRWASALSSIKPTITTIVKADTSQAQTAISNLANSSIRMTLPDGTTKTIGLFQYLKQYQGFASGGLVTGPGSSTSDSIMARLSNGEFVVNAAATSKYLPLLKEINGGKYAKQQGRYASGGIVEQQASKLMSPNINMTINPPAGMDERVLAKQISKELALQLRKGSIA